MRFLPDESEPGLSVGGDRFPFLRPEDSGREMGIGATIDREKLLYVDLARSDVIRRSGARVVLLL